MIRTLIVAVGLGITCASAVADVRVFVTSSASGYGLDLLGPQGDGTGTDPTAEDWPIDPFRPTYSTVDQYGHNDYAYDYYFAYYRVAAYPAIDTPSGTIDNPILINAGAGDWGYIWFQFRNEPVGAKLNAMITVATLAGQSQYTQDLSLTYYVQNDLYGSGAKRWGGPATPLGYPEWHTNPQYFTDGGAWWGIQNRSDDPQMMFHHQAGTKNDPGWTGVALLGALSGGPSDDLYELRITDIDYSIGARPYTGESCFFRIVPEPAGALWVALAAVSVGLRGRR